MELNHHPLNIKKRIKLWFVAREVPKVLDSFEHSLKNKRLSCRNNLKSKIGEPASYTTEYVSTIISHIYSDGKWEIKSKENYKETEKAITSNFIKSFNEGKDKNIIDFLPWYMPKVTKKPPEKKESSINLRAGDFLTHDYGQLSKIADLLQYAFSSNGSNLEWLFRETYSEEWSLYTPALSDFADALLEAYTQVITDIDAFSKKNNVPMTEQQKLLCFYNIANFYIHNLAMTGIAVPKKNQRELFWAVSSLHPVQDKLIDENSLTKDELESISEALSLGKTSSSSSRIKPLINLIEIVYKHLPLKKHKDLRTILLSLQEIQVASRKQKQDFDTISEEELLRISFTKGGYAFALFAYVINKKLSIDEFRHFFGMGAIFQLMDDIHDVEDDLSEGMDTIFTRQINDGKKLDNAIYGLMEMQRSFESNFGLLPSLRFPSIIRLLESFGFRYDTFRFTSMQSNNISSNFFEQLKEHFSFDVEGTVNFYKNTKTHERLEVFGLVIKDLQQLIKSLKNKNKHVENSLKMETLHASR